MLGSESFTIEEKDYYTNEEVVINSRDFLIKVIPNEKRVEIVLSN